MGTPKSLEAELLKLMITEENRDPDTKIDFKTMLEEVVVKKDEVPESDAKPLPIPR